MNYDASKIKVLKDADAIRANIGMFLGNSGKEGHHHCVHEIVDNSCDEAMGGFCNEIVIHIEKDGETISVEDNGRGIPVDIHPTEKIPALELALTRLHAGGKFENSGSSYESSGGLHGVGASCVNAVSDLLIAEVYRDGYLWQQSYSQGKPTSKVIKIRALGKKDKQHGTKITWHADKLIFQNGIKYDDKMLVRRFREMAFLNRGLSIVYSNASTGVNESFCFTGGISDYLKYLTEAKNGLYPNEPIFAEAKSSLTSRPGQQAVVQIALLYTEEDDESILSFVNNIVTPDGGTHVSGFKTSLTRVINTFARSNKLIKESANNLNGDDVREGLNAIVSIRWPRPEFVSQNKTKLGSTEAESVVSALTQSLLTSYFDKNAGVLKKIVERALISYEARNAAKKQSDLIKRKGFLGKSNRMPGKLYDCNSEKRELSELFIVEGDSAAGCFFGDTKVSLMDGRELSFLEIIEEHKSGKVNFCYSRTPDGKVVTKEIKNPRKTKKCKEWVKITLDNGWRINCTLNHKFMILDGSYVEAQDLIVGVLLKGMREDHKTTAIELCEGKMDFYDLEVEETHNFVLSADVFVHNSAKDGRDPEFQAILPVRGKIINAEKKDISDLLKNKEIQSLIIAIGTGIKEDFDIEKLRYHKIVIMCDADTDGLHISTLLLTFFYRYMKPLVAEGHVYLAQPPLFCVEANKVKSYCWTDKEMQDLSKKLGKTKVVRFKGLGEMDAEQLADTTMEVGNRRLIRLQIKDVADSERMVAVLMGSNVQLRKDHIINQVNSLIKK